MVRNTFPLEVMELTYFFCVDHKFQMTLKRYKLSKGSNSFQKACKHSKIKLFSFDALHPNTILISQDYQPLMSLA